MRIAVVAHRRTETNAALAAAAGGSLLSPRQALLALAAGDVALARLDVRDELDGIEPGLETLDRLEAGGVLVLNRSAALVAAHDKLLTARALRRAGPPLGHDLRLVVAGGSVVGAARREAAPGEWRTNVALGGTSSPAAPPGDACALALAAAAATGADLVGVDLLPVRTGYVILELNGAVDTQPWYAPSGDLAGDAIATLLREAAGPRAA
jgi:glutathione synthase/RimK-type ligase-like ATP-grasp enzyme